MHVLIRPRSGDFCYSEAETAVMLRDIEAARAAGAHGVVIGALTPAGDVDLEVTAQLVRAGAGLSVTFHRAFDLTRDPVAALDTLIALSIDRVLTSGQESRAIEGAPLIGELHRRAAGRIVVLPGGGISEDDAGQLMARTGVGELHFSASVPRRGAGKLGAARLSFTGTPHPDPDIRNHTSGERITAIMAAASQNSR
jgi:copper homeostasis protein